VQLFFVGGPALVTTHLGRNAAALQTWPRPVGWALREPFDTSTGTATTRLTDAGNIGRIGNGGLSNLARPAGQSAGFRRPASKDRPS